MTNAGDSTNAADFEMVIPSGTRDRFGEVNVLENVLTPMRDGVLLASDVYMPGGAGPGPTIVIRLPYGKRDPYCYGPVQGWFWARKGYACVVQDVRGKFGSEGKFEPFVNELADGYDTVDWITNQPWSNGAVGLTGESYFGLTSFLAAASEHPAIKAIAPGDICADLHRAVFRGGAFALSTMGYWALAMDAPEWNDMSRANPWKLPLIDLPSRAGLEGREWRSQIEHRDDREYWDEKGFVRALEHVRVPVLSFSGWYDQFTGVQIEEWQALRAASPSPDDVHLYVGPWDHESTDGKQDRAVCQPIPSQEQHRWDTLQAFFDRYLMGMDNGFGKRGPVQVFTIAADEWRSEPDWPLPGTAFTPWYLHSGGHLSQIPPDEEPADSFDYDPATPIAETFRKDDWMLARVLGDRREIEGRPDVLVYTSDPLSHDVEITGPIAAKLFAASSAVDTDFTVNLQDVFPDGTSNMIQDGIVRAAYREDRYRPQLVEPGRAYEYDVDMFATSYLVKAGHRLRVDISSSCFDRYDRNLNTGDRLGYGEQMVVAHQQIHHRRGMASHVIVPVARRP